ncbi:hypothetical protein ACFPM0_25325 [Pseudonocardia sulfidoxydans]|uniref:hypothetical protein n=1 Tax=Pseudonocardia sulfidoxydans TaxID=54011 RepID=UPI00360648B7
MTGRGAEAADRSGPGEDPGIPAAVSSLNEGEWRGTYRWTRSRAVQRHVTGREPRASPVRAVALVL